MRKRHRPCMPFKAGLMAPAIGWTAMTVIGKFKANAMVQRTGHNSHRFAIAPIGVA